ncbi:MAG TPA: hypothetical protein VFP93_05090, partial [Gammaproteobacteria bacterium]|nr:hypothetical protein [Gammaproteobacteria bacterium]
CSFKDKTDSNTLEAMGEVPGTYFLRVSQKNYKALFVQLFFVNDPFLAVCCVEDIFYIATA